MCGAVAAGGVCKGGAVGLGGGKRCGCGSSKKSHNPTNCRLQRGAHNVEFDFSQPPPSCLLGRDHRCTGIPRS